MKNNLTSKLKTGAMIGLAGLALGATAPKAKAEVIYDSENLSSTNSLVSGGKLIIDYRQTIDEIDTNGDSIMDSYKSSLFVKNSSQSGGVLSAANASFYELLMDADLAERGATGLTNGWLNWTYEKTGKDMSKMIMNPSGEWPLYPTLSDTFYYTIAKDQVLGWENVDAAMVANAGAVSFGLQAPIPEPTTMAILASGAAVLFGGRRIRNSYKQAA